jgi:hypothetical protein
MSKRNGNTFRPDVTLLEGREMPAVSAVSLAGGVVTVDCNNAASIVHVAQSATAVVIADVKTNHTWSFAANQVSRIDLYGGGGNDTLSASTSSPSTARLVRIFSGGGNDSVTGTGGPVYMQAGSGNDTLSAPSGNDTLMGGSGQDVLKGGTGFDQLVAGTGDTYMNAGTGVSTLTAGVGTDTLVAINGQATDTIQTGVGQAIMWVDDVNGTTDTIIGSTSGDVIQAVPGFTNAGATTTLNGGTFAEPRLLANNYYEAFANRPLFASTGPVAADVKQYINAKTGATELTDSWLLAGLAAIANEDPAAIENNVVDFGDGTYGVRLGNEFFRVDNKLPVNQYGSVTTAYASLGTQASLWVPIVEKAFAYYETQHGAPSYATLNTGATTFVYAAFGSTSYGSITFGSLGNANNLGTEISAFLGSNYSTAVGLVGAVTGTDVDTGAAVTLKAGKEYTVLDYTSDLNGNVLTVILRDPDGANSDGVEVTLANLYAAGANSTLDVGLV